MGALRRLLRPTRIIKRNAIMKGLLGGDRKWLVMGAIVFVTGKIKSLFGFGVPEPVYIEDVNPGDRFVIAHSEPVKRRKKRKKK